MGDYPIAHRPRRDYTLPRRWAIAITYSFDPQQGIIDACVAGPTSLADIEQHFRTVCAEPFFPAPALHDVREASANLSHAELYTIAERLREIAPRIGGAPIAVVVGNEMSFGLVRMIALLLDEIVTLKAFRHRDAAIEWLAEMRRTETPV